MSLCVRSDSGFVKSLLAEVENVTTGNLMSDSGAAFPLQASLFYWHGRLQQHMDVTVDRQLAEFGVTYRQWSLMSVLFTGQADTVRGVAAVLRLDPGAVTRLATRLCEKALMKRTPDERDARSVRLILTVAGREMVPLLSRMVAATEKSFTDSLSQSEQSDLKCMLSRMMAAGGDAVMTDYLECRHCPSSVDGQPTVGCSRQ